METYRIDMLQNDTNSGEARKWRPCDYDSNNKVLHAAFTGDAPAKYETIDEAKKALAETKIYDEADAPHITYHYRIVYVMADSTETVIEEVVLNERETVKHAPGLYKVIKDPLTGNLVIEMDNHVVAICFSYMRYAEANAEFIVTACNSHKKIIHLLTESLLGIECSYNLDESEHLTTCLRCRIITAIAKAEGK